jgi:hypothetical protein
MHIQRVTTCWYKDYAPRVRAVWALVDGPLAIRPADREEAALGYVVFHVPTGLAIDEADTKDAAVALVATLAGHVPASGALGVMPSAGELAETRKALTQWKMTQVW